MAAKALSVANGFMDASRATAEMQGSAAAPAVKVESVNAISHPQRPKTQAMVMESRGGRSAGTQVTCFCCGKSGHRREKCQFKEVRCYRCQTVGHLAKMCRSSGGRSMNDLDASDEQDWERPEGDESDEASIEFVSANLGWVCAMAGTDDPTGKWWIWATVNGMRLRMQADCGADVTVLSSADWNRIGKPPLEECQVRLKSYPVGSSMALGRTTVRVAVDDKSAMLPAYVVETRRQSLFGRPWMDAIRVNWNELQDKGVTGLGKGPEATVAKVDAKATVDKASSAAVAALLAKYNDLFEVGLGKIKGIEAKLTVKEGAKTPKFHRAKTGTLCFVGRAE